MKGLKQSINVAILLLSFLVLTACSSGGDSGAPPPPQSPSGPPASTNITLGGAAVKGIIKYARVEVFAIDENGIVITPPLVTSTTDGNGVYSITLDTNYSGPVIIAISDNNDPDTPSTMSCDVVAGCGTIDPLTGPEYVFGGDMPLGNIVLKAAIPNVTGSDTVTAAVTPFTHMAAAYAEQLSGGLTSDNIALANSKVGNMLGINNIITTIPPDISNQTSDNSTFNESKYAYLIAAIASLSQDNNFQGDIAAVLDSLVASYTGNGGELIGVETTDQFTVISLAELALHAMTQAQLNGADSQVESALNSLHWIAQSTVDLPTTTTPSPTTDLGDLEVVKAFVADVRTWGNVIDQEIQNNTSEFQQRVDMANTAFDTTAPLLSEAFELGFTAAFEAYVAGANANNDLASYFDPTDPVNPISASGGITVTDNLSTTTVVLDGFIKGIRLRFTAEGPQLDTNGSLIGTQFTLQVNDVMIDNPGASQNRATITAQSGTISVSYAESFPNGIDLTPWLSGTQTGNGSVPNPDSGTYNLTNVAITEIDVTDPISYSGSLQAEIVASHGSELNSPVLRDSLGDVVQYNPASIDFTGELSNSTNRITALVTANMPNAGTFLPVPPLPTGYIHSAIGYYAFSNNNNTLTIITPGMTRTFTFNPVDGSVTYHHSSTSYVDSWALQNTYASFEAFLAARDSWELTQAVYAQIDVEGEYIIYSPATWQIEGATLDGILLTPYSIDENTVNFRELSDINVTFIAQLEGLPEARFEVTGNRTGYDSGDLHLIIAYGGRRIEMTGDFVNGEAIGTVNITNQDGVLITYIRSDVTTLGAVYYNNRKYADIEEVNGITLIRYIDGYFDSL